MTITPARKAYAKFLYTTAEIKRLAAIHPTTADRSDKIKSLMKLRRSCQTAMKRWEKILAGELP